MRIGVDIVEISRIKNFVENNILDRVFSLEEIKYCTSKKLAKNKYQSFAARFAAKEAVIKALDDKTINLRDILVENLPSGKPIVKIKNRDLKIEISLSHCDKYAVAMVMVE